MYVDIIRVKAMELINMLKTQDECEKMIYDILMPVLDSPDKEFWNNVFEEILIEFIRIDRDKAINNILN